MPAKVAKKRGKKPAQKVVRQNPNENENPNRIEDNDDEAEFLLKMELIELVQGYPEIYDIAHPLHKKTYARNAAWEAIAEALYISVEEAKKLWQSLRDPFRKLEMTRGSGCGGDKRSGSDGMTIAEKVSTWAYYDKMSFLRPYIYSKE